MKKCCVLDRTQHFFETKTVKIYKIVAKSLVV